jgi:hypothetical protein
MSEHNFSAAMQMTMSSVVRNYLRWFELKRVKEAIGPAPLFPGLRALWQRYVSPNPGASPGDWSLRSKFLAEGGRKNGRKGLESAKERSQSMVLADAHDWQRSEIMDDQPELADDRE